MALTDFEDARALARCPLSRVFYEYIDGAAFGEGTARHNVGDFSHWTLEQRVPVYVLKRSQAVKYLGKDYATAVIAALRTEIDSISAHMGVTVSKLQEKGPLLLRRRSLEA